jgi:hypothetical protein
MDATGIIFAALDCDADAIEAWNRWYDLEHTPPNLALDGIMQSRRYVATAEMHDVRTAAAGGPYADGRSVFLTVYTLLDDPKKVFDGMVGLREKLVDADRMFPDEKKIVRMGDVLARRFVRADPALKADPEDVAFIGHTGLIAIERTGGDPDWYEGVWSPRVVAVDGVHAVTEYTSINRPGTAIDLVFTEGDPVGILKALREAAPHADDATVTLEGPFLLIDSLRYPWADGIRDSWLPKKVTD